MNLNYSNKKDAWIRFGYNGKKYTRIHNGTITTGTSTIVWSSPGYFLIVVFPPFYANLFKNQSFATFGAVVCNIREPCLKVTGSSFTATN